LGPQAVDDDDDDESMS